MKSAAFCLMVICLLSGCTIVKYTDGQKSLAITDIRITGSAIDLDATLNEVGKLSVNREQGSALDGAASVIEVLP